MMRPIKLAVLVIAMALALARRLIRSVSAHTTAAQLLDDAIVRDSLPDQLEHSLGSGPY
jgi:hypothetical protein